MSMFFDVFCEDSSDAADLESLLRGAVISEVTKLTEGEHGTLDPAPPLSFGECELSSRSRAIREAQLNHPVNKAINLTVKQSRTQEAEDLVVELLSQIVHRIRARMSLTAHGEHLLLRVQPGAALELFNGDYFWNQARLSSIQKAASVPLVVEKDRKWLE